MTDLLLAAPRGTLFPETLDLLDRLGLDTSEVRANERTGRSKLEPPE